MILKILVLNTLTLALLACNPVLFPSPFLSGHRKSSAGVPTILSSVPVCQRSLDSTIVCIRGHTFECVGRSRLSLLGQMYIPCSSTSGLGSFWGL